MIGGNALYIALVMAHKHIAVLRVESKLLADMRKELYCIGICGQYMGFGIRAISRLDPVGAAGIFDRGRLRHLNADQAIVSAAFTAFSAMPPFHVPGEQLVYNSILPHYSMDAHRTAAALPVLHKNQRIRLRTPDTMKHSAFGNDTDARFVAWILCGHFFDNSNAHFSLAFYSAGHCIILCKAIPLDDAAHLRHIRYICGIAAVLNDLNSRFIVPFPFQAGISQLISIHGTIQIVGMIPHA